VVPRNLAPGTYELRIFSGTPAARAAVSNQFSVTTATPSPTPPAAASLVVRPGTVAAGGVLSASWSGIAAPSSTDWIGLYPSSGAPDTPRPAISPNTTGQSSGQIAIPIPTTQATGTTYELRLFSGTTGQRLATSNTFSITAPLGEVVGPGVLLGGALFPVERLN
jgi:hypothetical protein